MSVFWKKQENSIVVQEWDSNPCPFRPSYLKLKMKKVSCVLALGMMAMLLLCQVSVTKAVTCTVAELASCTPAFTSPTLPPSKECCSKLMEQQPCFCGYLRDPALKPFIGSPNARRIVNACSVPIPKC
ncbi:hypothetical protein RJ640_010999 [Escallonia rubra]|uniref:Bifunctional inhibitor/plant lipid transfer protein/seed storage helical domain-containing protein n=1 Tax=Escallonia rubra TaxID=112253 RepID=A0AA88UJ02_9ASTE|nr:hypothetical protein RJ640_010999 [Escallonia rubra]